jgi:hypothetical protein
MDAKLATKVTEERRDPNFLAKAFMTCLPVTVFDKRNKRKPQAEAGGVQHTSAWR